MSPRVSTVPGRPAVANESTAARPVDSGGVARGPSQALALNTISFAGCFAAWVLFGPSCREIAAQLHLSPTTAALVKAAPILSGSLLRIPVGVATDRLGARAMFPALMLCGAMAAWWLSAATGAAHLLAGGLLLGAVGATFTVGVQSVSSWTRPERRGFALGVFGAGNLGTAVTTFGLPVLIEAVGWRPAFRVYAVGLVALAALYAAAVRNAPQTGPPPPIALALAALRGARTARLGFYYMATFGVFVALTLSLGDIYIDGFGLTPRSAGALTTTFTFTASLARIYGGRLADRFGARDVLRPSLAVMALTLFPVALALPLPLTVALVFVGGLAAGIGMAAVFKFVPDYFPRSVGAVSGVVGALGGLGGFFLPMALSATRLATGSVHASALPLAFIAAAAAVLLQFYELPSAPVAPRQSVPAAP